MPLILFVTGCGEPLEDAERAALGPEESGVPEGPLHRPGQPCNLCHDGSTSDEVFSVAGTVYREADSEEAAVGVEVRVIDYVGNQARVKTNAAGNFFLREDEFSPRWPIWVKLVAGESSIEMTSPIYREGSCGGCHRDAGDPSHPARVHLGEAK